MRTLILPLVLLMAGCTAQTTSTPKCDEALGEGWGEHLGSSEVESSTNLDSNRCAQFNDVWCCVF